MNQLVELSGFEEGNFDWPRLPLDETLMTLLLLSEQPFVAVDASIQGDTPAPGTQSCVLVRVEERWARA